MHLKSSILGTVKVLEWLAVNAFLLLIALVGAGVVLFANKIVTAFRLQEEWWAWIVVGFFAVAVSCAFAMGFVRVIGRR